MTSRSQLRREAIQKSQQAPVFAKVYVTASCHQGGEERRTRAVQALEAFSDGRVHFEVLTFSPYDKQGRLDAIRDAGALLLVYTDDVGQDSALVEAGIAAGIDKTVICWLDESCRTKRPVMLTPPVMWGSCDLDNCIIMLARYVLYGPER